MLLSNSTTNDHTFTIPIIEDMYPFERDIYYGLLVKYIEERNELRKQSQG